MGANPILIVDEELLQKLPKEFQSDPRYQKGASLALVPIDEPASKKSVDGGMAAWNSLRGLLADSDYDPNAELEKEKQRELEEEARWARS